MFKKPPEVKGCDARIADLERLRPRLEQEAARRSELADLLKRKYQVMVGRENDLIAQVKRIDELRSWLKEQLGDQELKAEVRELIAEVSAMTGNWRKACSLGELRPQAMSRLEQMHAALGKLKAQYGVAAGVK